MRTTIFFALALINMSDTNAITNNNTDNVIMNVEKPQDNINSIIIRKKIQKWEHSKLKMSHFFQPKDSTGALLDVG